MQNIKFDLTETSNTVAFYNVIEKKAKELTEQGPRINARICSGYECDKYSRVYNIYATVGMIRIHDFLRNDLYSEDEKREVLEPYLGMICGSVDEELDLILTTSKRIDLIEELLMECQYQSDLFQQQRDFYFDILLECGSRVLDKQIGSATEISGYDKVIDEENRLNEERSRKFEESAREMLHSNGLM